MRSLLCCSLILLLASPAAAATIAKPFTFSPGSTISSSQMNSCFDAIYNDYNGNINSNNLATNAVGSDEIQASAVTTAKILDANVTLAKIVSASAASKLVGRGSAAGAGVFEEISPDASTIEINATSLRVKASGITSNELASNAVTTLKIADANVTTAKVLDGNITLAKIVNASAASRLMIRGSAAGAGVWQEGTLDGTTVEFNGTAIRVKASGITSNELGSNSVTTVKVTDLNVTTAKLAANAVDDTKMSALSVVPVGTVFDYAGASTPSGWLLCDGSAVSRTTYSALFTAISTTYGVGDGSTTFNLPDCRGRLIAGKDNMGGVTASRITNAGSGIVGTTLGAAGGLENHTMTTAELVAHVHSITLTTQILSGGGVSCYGPGGGSINTNSTGSSTPFTVTQPTIIMNKIIKAGV